MFFSFSISDLGIFVGKSPVTIRHWERKEFIPRLERVGMNRAMSTQDVLRVATIAHRAGRITDERMALISETVGLLNLIEQEDS